MTSRKLGTPSASGEGKPLPEVSASLHFQSRGLKHDGYLMLRAQKHAFSLPLARTRPSGARSAGLCFLMKPVVWRREPTLGPIQRRGREAALGSGLLWGSVGPGGLVAPCCDLRDLRKPADHGLFWQEGAAKVTKVKPPRPSAGLRVPHRS